MAKPIKLLMWEHQSSFRTQMEHRAKNMLQKIAPTIKPHALLVGIRVPDKMDGCEVCVEPENDIWDTEMFSNCFIRANDIYEAHSAEDDKTENIHKRSVLEAINEVLQQYDNKNDTTSFCGAPIRVEGYYVTPILQVLTAQLLEYPQLSSPIVYESGGHSWVSSKGLVESFIRGLLEGATSRLTEAEPGRLLDYYKMKDEMALLRAAGRDFCDTILYAPEELHYYSVFESLNMISSLLYEGEELSGGIVFSLSKASCADIKVALKESVQLDDYRMVRKLLEMSNPNFLCLYQGQSGIYGFGSSESVELGNVFHVVFTGHYKWKLLYKDTTLMISEFGVPRLPTLGIKDQEFYSKLLRVFPSMEKNQAHHLWNVVESAIMQKHGTMLVISEIAVEEAERLKFQSISVRPFYLTPEIVPKLIVIDGAILIEPNGICHAIGVILDGFAASRGDSSRGARYNSAILYISSVKAKTICVVVSEDGYVDLLPFLNPQIKKSEIEGYIELLKTQDGIDFHKTVNWLDVRRFYFTTEQCDLINKELNKIEAESCDVGEIALARAQFEPDTNMNDSYYLPE